MDLEANVQIGDFRIVKRLGAGGMGIVYLAKQVSLDRLVALKILGQSLTQPSDKARFLREAQAVAKLKHPIIASVHYIGQDSQVCYYAMEYIDGVSLRAVIENLRTSHDPDLTLETALNSSWTADGTSEEIRFDQPTADYPPESVDEPNPIGPGEISREARKLIATKEYIRHCCEIIKTVALALAHAHEKGVIHRDIKPGNLLLDRNGNVYLIDFGIARFFEDTTVTQTGALIGTPMYMSPEQVTGRIELDHRTDIYSLGLVLYELLSIQRPIQSPTREGILRKIVTKAMVPITWLNRDIPRDLESIVHKATSKDPDQRYQFANGFASDLQRFLDDESVEATHYHYNFDDSSIVAERPGGIILVAFLVFLLSLYVMGNLVYELAKVIVSYSNANAMSTILYSLLLILSSLTCSYLLYLVGRRLLEGHNIARWIVIAAFTLFIIAFCAFIIISSTSFYVVRERRIRQLVAVVYMMFIDGSILFGLLLPIVVLLRRRTRDWFRLAERLRAEHRQQDPSAY
jgi:serine/threonine protein kinase